MRACSFLIKRGTLCCPARSCAAWTLRARAKIPESRVLTDVNGGARPARIPPGASAGPPNVSNAATLPRDGPIDKGLEEKNILNVSSELNFVRI